MKFKPFGIVFAAIVLLLMPSLASAQGARSSLSGVVQDSQGGVLPGVTVVLTDPTGTTMQLVTNEKGLFSAPSISSGTYKVTMTLEGFKTVLLDKVIVAAASPATLNVTMVVGGVEQMVEVKAYTGLVQTQSATVATTLDTDAIQKLPMVTRNVMQSLPALLVGIDQTGGDRSATINGLPQNSVKLTMDGIDVKNVQGEGNGGGFYAFVYPAADAIEAVTVTSATQSAESSGDGSASVRFVTKGGTDRYTGSFFEYLRDKSLNTNYFFNDLKGLPKNTATIHNFGATVGGPIRIPKMVGKGRAFFFVDLEEYYHPNSVTSTRTVLSPDAQQGIFGYNTPTGVKQVNLFTLAGKNGQLATANPTIAALLTQIRSGVSSTGVITQNADSNTQAYTFQFDGPDNVPQPSGRIDVNLPHGSRLTATYHYVGIDWTVSSAAPVRFPGLPNSAHYWSTRTTGSTALRTVVNPNIVNVATFGTQNQRTYNSPTVTADQFANQGGFNLTFPTIGGVALTSATATTGRQNRHAPLWSVEDSVNWQHGLHTISFGGSFTRYINDLFQDQPVAGVAFGVQTGVDPADAMFTTANFPGASTADLTSARALYGFLSGRVTSVIATAALTDQGKYEYLGRSYDKFHLSEGGVFIQDQWRMTPHLTVNAGVRYQIQLAPTPEVGNYTAADITALCGVSGTGSGLAGCNMFTPGSLTGSTPHYTQFTPGSTMFAADRNNIAPNIGVAWQPNIQGGILRKILGDPSQATIRAGFGISFDHEPLGTYLSVFQANPGRSFSATRSAANANLVLPGQTWPVLFSSTDRLGAPAACSGAITAACYPALPTYPVTATTANNMSVFDPKLQEPYNRQYSLGIQRAISKDMALEVRYVGTRSFGGINTVNMNEITVKENGFLNEFKLAQNNLYANIAAGRGQTFAYFGAGSGTSPLPIFLASFNGVAATSAGDSSKYTGANWTSSTFTGFLNRLNPSPASFASTNTSNGLFGNSTFRNNGRNAGLPVNFWLVNPDVGTASYTSNTDTARYDGLQVELRRRLSHGLLLTSSYAFSRSTTSDFSTIHQGLATVRSLSGVPQSVKFAASWDLPYGHGRAFGQHAAGWLDAIAGGWTLSGVGRAQTGQQLRVGGSRLVGMTEKELQKEFKIRIDRAAGIVYDLPQDIIDNTIRAYSANATGYTQGTPTGRYLAPASTADCVEVYRGDCGEAPYINLTGPIVSRLDLTFRKSVKVGKKRLDFEYDVFNAFNAIQFNPVFQASSSATINQVTTGYTNGNTDEPGGRIGQVVFRFVW